MGSSSTFSACGVYPSRFSSRKRAAFQSLLAKLRPSSKRSEACRAVGSSGSSSGHGPPGRNGFLQLGHVTFRVRMYMCSCFIGTSASQCGHTLDTGIRLSWLSVATLTMP
jgi:hypothetical protein